MVSLIHCCPTELSESMEISFYTNISEVFSCGHWVWEIQLEFYGIFTNLNLNHCMCWWLLYWSVQLSGCQVNGLWKISLALSDDHELYKIISSQNFKKLWTILTYKIMNDVDIYIQIFHFLLKWLIRCYWQWDFDYKH